MSTRANWIRGLRRHMKANQAEFAELLGVTQPTVSRWENGAEPEISQWEALNKVAKSSGYALLDVKAAVTAPLVGFVGAGASVNLYASGQGPFEEVEMPPRGTETTVAVEVRGDSMAGIADDKWIIYYDNRQEPVTEELFGKLCVVGLAGDGVLVKKLQPGRKPGRFDLYSSNGAPLLDQEVIWAARVEWIRPR